MPRFRVRFHDAPFAWVEVDAAHAQDAEFRAYESYARHCLGCAAEAGEADDWGPLVEVTEVEEGACEP